MAKFPILMIGGGAVLWAGVCVALWRFQEKLIFFPKPVPPDVVREFTDAEITVDAENGVILHGWQHPGNTAAPQTDCDLFIYFGGNNEEVSHHLTDNGERFACPQWYINYRGYGQSGGNPTNDTLRADALHIVDAASKWLADKGINAPKICIMGRSLGSHMAAHAAANRQVHKLILVTPFDSALNVARSRYPIFPVAKLLRHPFNTLAEAPKVRAKTLFVLAAHDNIVPIAGSRRLIAAWTATHKVVQTPNTSHQHIETSDYWREVGDFMAPDN